MDIKEFILAKCLKGQSDIEIITEKDYISQPILLEKYENKNCHRSL